MDFNQILLFAGLGLLLIVVLFALWGFLGGLKRELSCIAVFIVLLVLAWLVFGDSATLLNAKVGQQVAGMLDLHDSSITTLWDAVLAFAKANIPNGEALLVEGKETYTLFYGIASTVCHAVGLIVGTLAILIICPIIRLITHFIGLIIRAVKKSKAKKNPPVESTEEVEKEKEMVVVSRIDEAEEAVFVKDANEIPEKPKGKRRLWGALAGALKGVFVIILVCVPLSGISSIFGKFTPETKALVKDLVNGDAKVNLAESNDNPVDMAFEFADAYDHSALGKFANGSSFFFGESFSEKLFDQLLKLETKNQVIYLSDEIEVFIEAVNNLEGNLDFEKMSRNQYRNFLETLKQAKLPAELMPVAIEYAYEVESINKILKETGVEANFLELRYNNWKHDIDLVLSALQEAYDLDLFPIKDLNYLKLDTEELRDVVSCLGQTEFMKDGYPLAVKILLNLQDVKKQIGTVTIEKLDDLDVASDLDALVSIYDVFKKFGIETFEGFDFDAFIKDVLKDDVKIDLVFDIAHRVLDLQIARKVAVPVAFGFAKNNEKFQEILAKAKVEEDFAALEKIVTLDDLATYLDAVKVALDLVDLSEYPTIKYDYFHLDADLMDDIIDRLFASKATDPVLKVASKIALSLDVVTNNLGDALKDVDLSSVDWKTELKTFVSIYREFLKLGFESLDDFKGDKIDLVQGLIEDETKYNAISNMLSLLVDAQLYTKLAVPTMQYFLDKYLDEHYVAFNQIFDLGDITKDEWKQDFQTLLESAKLVNELKVLDNINPFDYKALDIASDSGIAKIKQLIQNIFELNILGDDQLKTALLVASIKQFNWVGLDEEYLEDSTKWNIRWTNEEEVLLQLVDIYSSVVKLDEFDIFDLQSTDWVALLESDEFLDYVVSALETVVDSDIVLELLPNLLDKYLLPRLEAIESVDDETLFKDIFEKLPSDELVNEIIKLIDVVKNAVKINLIGHKANEIDFSNVDALKAIVSGIFDSKLIQGFEGRIIRILLKVTKLLELDPESSVYQELVEIDYSGEKEALLNFLDAIAPVLQDPDFKILNDEGKLNLTLKFWSENEKAQSLLNGLKALLGSYPDNDETSSKLIEVLLPAIYGQYVDGKDIIPSDYKELIDELDIANATGEQLTSALRRLIFVAEELVKIDAQSLLDGGDMEIASEKAIDSFKGILDALHDIELFRGHEAKVLAWGVNFVAKQLKINVDPITDEFDNVDWLGQNEVYKDILDDLGLFLRNNDIITLNQLKDFIKDKKYNTSEFITKENMNDLLDIVDKVVDVQVIDAVMPLVVKYGVQLLNDRNVINLDYVKDFTNEEINHDVHSIVAIAHKLVDELDIVSYYNAKFDGDMPLPNVEVVQSLVDDIFELNIITKAEGRLGNAIFDMVASRTNVDETLSLTAEDFKFASIDWSEEKEVFKDLIAKAYDFLEVNNITTMTNLQRFFKEKWYTEPAILRDETGYVASDVLRVLQNSQLVENVIVKLYQYGIDYVSNNKSFKLPFDISYMREMEAAELLADLGVVADIADKAVKFGIMSYLADGDIHNIDITILADAVEEDLTRLNILAHYGQRLIGDAANYGLNYLESVTHGDFVLSQENINEIDYKHELVVLADTIRSAQAFLDAKNIRFFSDIFDFVDDVRVNSPLKNKAFFDRETYDALVDIASAASNLQLLELLGPQLLNHAIRYAEQVKVDLSFLDTEEYTGAFFVEDIRVVLEMADYGYDFGLIDLAFDKTLYTLEFEALCNMLDSVPELHLAQLYYADLVALGVNNGLKAVKIEKSVDRSLFAEIDLNSEIKELKEVLMAIKPLLAEKEVVTLTNLIDLVKAQYPANTYKMAAFYDIATGELLEKVVYEAADLQTLAVLLPKALNYGVDRLTQVNLSFLKDSFTSEELASDLKVVSGLIVPAIKAELVGLAFGAKVNDLPLHFDVYNEMLDVVKDLNILQAKYGEFVSMGTNSVLKALKSTQEVTADLFSDVVLADEAEALKNVINRVATLAEELDAKTVYDVRYIITDLIQNKQYKEEKYTNRTTVTELLDIVDAALDVQTVQLLLTPTITTHLSEFASLHGVDLAFLFRYATREALVEDLDSIVVTLRDLVDYGMLEFALRDGSIDVTDITPIKDAIDRLAHLHILENNHADVVFLVLDKLGIDKTGVDLSNIDLDQEVASIQDILEQAKEILLMEDVDQYAEIKGIDFNKYLKLDSKTNEYIDVFAPLLKVLAKDQLVERLGLAVSRKYLANFASKYEGLADIYNIYTDGKQLTSDLSDLADILLEIRAIDLVSSIASDNPYPYDKVENISKIIKLLLSLNYFNIDENRADDFVKALDPHVKADLSSVDAKGVDLRSDADIFAAMYEDLANILTHESFPIKSKNDLNPVKFNNNLLKSSLVYESAVDALLKFMDTTVYNKTAAGLIMLTFPLVEKYAPEYYSALDLAVLTKETITEDLPLLKDILLKVDAMDLGKLAEEKSVFTAEVEDLINTVIDSIAKSQILANHGNAVFEVTMDKFVNGKTLGNIVIPTGAIVADGVDFVEDKDLYKQLISKIIGLLNRQDVYTIQELKDYVNAFKANAKAELLSFVSLEENDTDVADILKILTDITIVEVNGLSIMNNIVHPALPSALGKVIDFTMFTKDEFASDLKAAALMVSQFNQFGLASIARNENINYNQAKLVQAMLENIVSTNYVKYNLDSLIDYVDGFNLPIKFEALKADEFDYKHDANVLAQVYEQMIPFLTSNHNPLKTRRDIKDLISNNFKLDTDLKQVMKEFKNDLLDAYDELVQMTAIPLLLNELANYGKALTPTNYKHLFDLLAIDELTYAEKADDVMQTARILRLVVDLELYKVVTTKDYNFAGDILSTLYGKEESKVTLITSLVDEVYALNVLRNRSDLMLELLNALETDTTEVDLSDVDWDNEVTQLKVVIANGLELLLEYDIQTIQNAKDYARDLLNLRSANAILDELKAINNKVNVSLGVEIFEAIDESKAFDQIFKPLYNKYVFTKLPAKFVEVGDLSEYKPSDLAEDIHSLAIAARALLNIKDLEGTVKDNRDSAECISQAQAIIKALFSLNYLDLKKQALVDVAADIRASLKLDTLDVTGVNFKADGEIIAEYAEQILMILTETNILRAIRFDQFGDTYLMSDVVELYNGLVETTLFDAVSVWAFRAHVEPRIEDIEQLKKYSFTDEKIHLIGVKFGETLDAMLDMGFFSNYGVDFTNKENTDRLFVLLTDVFEPSDKVSKLVDKFKANMAEFGIIDLSYEGINAKPEFDALKAVMSSVSSFAKTYMNKLTSDFTVLVDPTFQDDLVNVFEKVFASRMLAQLALPLMSGSVRILTQDTETLHLLDNLDNDEFLNIFLPDLFDLFAAADKLDLLNKKVNYNDASAIVDAFDVLVHKDSFKDYVSEIVKFAMVFVGINVKDVDLSKVDWDKEYQAIDKALNGALKEPLKDVKASDRKTFLNETFLNALAIAMPEFNDSDLIPLLSRQLLEFMANKVAGDSYDTYVNRLFEPDYTDELLVEDYKAFPEILKLIAKADLFAEGGLTNDKYPIIGDLLEKLLALNFAEGIEPRLLETCFKRTSALDSYDVDFETVLDWAAERAAFAEVLRKLGAFASFEDVDVKDTEMQDNFVALVGAMSKSEIGRQLLPQIYDQNIEPKIGNLGEDYQGVIDFNDPEFTPDVWADEFRALFDAYNKLDKMGPIEELDMKQKQTQDDFVGLVGIVEKSIIGRKLFKKIWASQIATKLGEDYADIIDLEQEVWSNQFTDMFEVYTAFTKFASLDDIDMSSQEDQNTFLDAVEVAAKTEVGQKFFKKIYGLHIKPALSKLGEDYDAIINVETLAPEMWKDEFAKLFNAYNKFSQEAASLTIDDSIELMNILFGTDMDHKDDGIKEVVAHPDKWVKKVLDPEKSYFTLPDHAKLDNETERDWLAEAYALKAVLEAMKAFADESPEYGGKFNYDVAYKSTDSTKIKALFLAVSKCKAVRGSMVEMIFDATAAVPGMQEQLETLGVIDETLKAEKTAYESDPTHFNEAYWTEDRITNLAEGIARANEVLNA